MQKLLLLTLISCSLFPMLTEKKKQSKITCKKVACCCCLTSSLLLGNYLAINNSSPSFVSPSVRIWDKRINGYVDFDKYDQYYEDMYGDRFDTAFLTEKATKQYYKDKYGYKYDTAFSTKKSAKDKKND